MLKRIVLSLIIGSLQMFPPSFLLKADAAVKPLVTSKKEMDKKLVKMMKEGNIPGMSIITIQGDKGPVIKHFGFSDLENKVPVTPKTLFELASCSKAFTALALLQLEEKGVIHLDDPVSKHLPWFFVKYKNRGCKITLRQLLHHSSGIPWNTISKIPGGSHPGALEKTVKRIVGIELNHMPGTQFEYATINYDIVGLVIEKVSGKTFEDYMVEMVFKPLGLTNTTVGVKKNNPKRASGYKFGFFSPRQYNAPVFDGNNPAGYVISNAVDVQRWLKIQLGLIKTDFDHLIKKSHLPNDSVPPHPVSGSQYAMGWEISKKSGGMIFHRGLNPNFSAYMCLKPKLKVAVAVLANVNSADAYMIGDYIMSSLSGEKFDETIHGGVRLDTKLSTASIAGGVILIILFTFFILIIRDIFRGTRQFEAKPKKKFFRMVTTIFPGIPILLGIYLLPEALLGVSWHTALVWGPMSLPLVISLGLAGLAFGYIIFCFTLFFPLKITLTDKQKFLRFLPLLIFLSFVSGASNAAAVLLISISFFTTIPLKYLLYYFFFVLFLYAVSRKAVQSKMILITNDFVYKNRMKLIKKVFLTTYQKFEKIDNGRFYATLNNDTEQISRFANIAVQLSADFFTAIAAILYLSFIYFWPTVATMLLALFLGIVYSSVAKRYQILLEETRDTQNVFMKLAEGLVKGYRELSMHMKKKREYEADVEESCSRYRNKKTMVFVSFVKINIINEFVMLTLLALICIGVPRLFPEMSLARLISFVMVLLFMSSPVSSVMAKIPELMQVRVAWNRIKGFINDIPASHLQDNTTPTDRLKYAPVKNTVVENFKVEKLMFEYKNQGKVENFKVGPFDMELKKGDILFLVGGNGSGKTTIAKLLSGLYMMDTGKIKINGNEVNNGDLGEYFSVVLDEFHLFEKLYGIDVSNKEEKANKLLNLLKLQEKLTIESNKYSTIDLSGGQRKRIALLQCYLEDRPIYLFDEVAADQDPEFRKFFYKELLVRMKQEGKIVIAITHDDHYFDMADKIIKLDMGKIDATHGGKVLLGPKKFNTLDKNL